MGNFELAQVNISRMQAPLDDESFRDFVDALEPVNAIADRAPGFVWRLQTEDGDATSIRAFEWDVRGTSGILVNMSVWTSVEALADFVFSGDHVAIMKRRREWFHHVREAMTVLWWVPAGHRPTTAEAEAKIKHLRVHGPTPEAFTLKQHFSPAAAAREGDPGWLCPA
ncbi:hypothetical protein H4696_009464 [Amycolatopsis lexingtonensis]|uniref:DUF3291 domain-containing protein n=1 Tax=Amycolatopsis lexingtonensis TaxID=218822 RepID=A0ABR9IGS2_9PSEU|nr:DUF3291 domain-containing protein [Amycolatopsis lexingtonensis]MBE1502364.1 hypothetical protein [Amycolatopsis lexingtonensis]